MQTTQPPSHPATLRERIEHDRANQPGPTHSQGGGSTRLAALVAAARERLPTKG